MKFRLLVCILMILYVSCGIKLQNKTGCREDFKIYKNDLSNWTENLNLDTLVSHFPKELCNTNSFFRFSVNTSLFGDNSSGVFYLEELSYPKIISTKAKYSFKDSSSYYSPEAFRIKRFVFNDTSSKVINNLSSHYPLPTFYFGLNKGPITQTWKNEMDLMNIPKDQIIYSVPDDLMIYIIDAEPGCFWKNKENIRPRPSLGIWTFGYSRGIAVSESQEIICYWLMIW